MREIVAAVGLAIGVLWLADAYLNDGRYEQTIESEITALVGE
jgi:hypothetical protein